MFQTSRSVVANRAPISGGQASPPRISNRTRSRASVGHICTRVGTVETMVILFLVSHGPRSTPDFTRERGAVTRQAP